MKNNNHEKENKRQKLLGTVGLTAIIICIVTLFSLFTAMFRGHIQSLLWPLAIICLVVDLIFWIIPTLDTLPAKKQRYLKRYRIIFSVLGGVLFVIDAFVFIDKKILSCMLVTIVLCLFVGLILLKKVYKDSSNMYKTFGKKHNMENLKFFINYLNNLDLSADVKKTANDMYNELETVDFDLDAKPLRKSKTISNEVKSKMIDLIEFYHAHADDCINCYSKEETLEFLKRLKHKANEVNQYTAIL